MSDHSDLVQRARQALEAWPGQPITDDDRKVNAVIGSITVAQYDLVRDLLTEVERLRDNLADERVTVTQFQQEATDTLNLHDECGPDELADAIRAAQAWAAWFAAERDEILEELEASQRAHILAVRVHSASLKADAAERDKLCAEIDRLRAMLDTDNLVDIVERADAAATDARKRATEAEKASRKMAEEAAEYLTAQLAAEAERDRLRATIQRVRALLTDPIIEHHDDDPDGYIPVRRIRQALNQEAGQ